MKISRQAALWRWLGVCSLLLRRNAAFTLFQGPTSAGGAMGQLADAVMGRNAEHPRPFDLDTAVLCGSKSFQAYVPPAGGAAVRTVSPQRAAEFAVTTSDKPVPSPLESTATALAVCWHDRAFMDECFLGEVRVRLDSITGLRPEEDLGQRVLTGAARDLYIVAWLSPVGSDKAKAPPAPESVPPHALPLGIVRSTTKWRLGGETGEASLEGEEMALPVPRDVDAAKTDVVFLLMDENVGKEDEVLGHARLPLKRILTPSGPLNSGWTGGLRFSVPAPLGPGALGGVVIGGMVGGPMGAALGAGAAVALRYRRGDATLRISARVETEAKEFIFGKSNEVITQQTVEALGKNESQSGYQFGDITRGLIKRAQEAARIRNETETSERVADAGDGPPVSRTTLLPEATKKASDATEASNATKASDATTASAATKASKAGQASVAAKASKAGKDITDEEREEEQRGYRLGDITRGILRSLAAAEAERNKVDADAATEEKDGKLLGGAAEMGSANARTPRDLGKPYEAKQTITDGKPDRMCGATSARGMLDGTLEDWTTLCPVTKGLSFELIASIDEVETDTQGCIWRSRSRGELVLAFRGTEQDRWRDLFTDATLVQEPWEDVAKGKANDSSRLMVHAGFKRAYFGVREAVRAAVSVASQGPSDTGGYRLLCTGHSLGGALATLAAYDLVSSGAARHCTDVDLYTFGAPRVGNRRFCEAVNAAVPTAYRVVNGQDIIARLPRGAIGAALGAMGTTLYGALDYSHPGIPVLVDERQQTLQVASKLLRNAEDADPTLPDEVMSLSKSLFDAARSPGSAPDRAARAAEILNRATDKSLDGLSLVEDLEGDPFRDPLGEGSLLAELSREMEDIFADDSRVTDAIEAAEAAAVVVAKQGEDVSLMEGLSNYAQQLVDGARRIQDTGERLNNARQKISGRVSERFSDGIKPEEVLSILGLRTEFLEAEMALLNSITTGQALTHHLEPSYYAALMNAKGFAVDPEELEVTPEEAVQMTQRD